MFQKTKGASSKKRFFSRSVKHTLTAGKAAGVLVLGGAVFGVLDFLIHPECFREAKRPEPVRERSPGKAGVSPSIIDTRSDYGTVKVSYTVSEEGFVDGGSIRLSIGSYIEYPDGGSLTNFILPHGFGLLQNVNENRANFVSARLISDTDADVEVGKIKIFPLRTLLRLLGRTIIKRAGIEMFDVDIRYLLMDIQRVRVKVVNSCLREGDIIEITLGDRLLGGKGWKLPSHSVEINAVLEVDNLRLGRFYPVESEPLLRVAGMKAESLNAVIPSTAGMIYEDKLKMSVVPRDEDGAPCYGYGGTVHVREKGDIEFETICMEIPSEGFAGRLDGNPSMSMYESFPSAVIDMDISKENTDVKRFSVNLGKLSCDSNPCWTSNADCLAWGDLHLHSSLDDGSMNPETVLMRARDFDRLDFAAVSIHDTMWRVGGGAGADRDFEYLCRLSDEMCAEGSFTVLRGYEWTSHRYGHRNVYFSPNETRCPVFNIGQKGSDTPDGLIGLLDGIDCLVIPHHTAWRKIRPIPVNWFKWYRMNVPEAYCWGTDKESQRLVEIYSMQGCSETPSSDFPIVHGKPKSQIAMLWNDDSGKPSVGNYIQEALCEGYRFGIIAGADQHDHGLDESVFATMIYKPGLTAVWAGDKTHNEIWKGLKDRRTYATTGSRILIDFSVEGQRMGGEVKCSNDPGIFFRASGTGLIERIEIIKGAGSNLAAIAEFKPERMDFSHSFEDKSYNRDSFYYLRLRQKDGATAWTSPVWVRI